MNNLSSNFQFANSGSNPTRRRESLLHNKGTINSFIRKNTIGIRVKKTRANTQTYPPYSLMGLIFGPNGNVPHEEEEYPFDNGWKCNIF
jgi:hypothetical protein